MRNALAIIRFGCRVGNREVSHHTSQRADVDLPGSQKGNLWAQPPRLRRYQDSQVVFQGEFGLEDYVKSSEL